MISFIYENKKKLDKYISEILNNKNIEPVLKEAMYYSLSDGKAVRASLLLETLKALDKSLIDDSAYHTAMAIEMIHAYSLIHDDLPAIDNDDFRRGKLSVHKKFGEDIAIVSGDALGGYAFYYLSATNYPALTKVNMIKELALAAGPEGMISGQVMDMRYTINSVDELDKMHSLKTGKMIELPVKLALLITETDKNSELYHNLLKYSYNLGIAFQARDDLLDVTGDEKIVGKKLQKDKKQNKINYIDFWGVEGTKNKINELIDDALDYIKSYNFENLENIAYFLKTRDF